MADKTLGLAAESWGRMVGVGQLVASDDLARDTVNAALSRGLGRSYGDSSLPAAPTDKVVQTPLADRVLAFDTVSGLMKVEAGFCLDELNRLFLRQGWFTPVTPGTKFVTVGGMVASDVHGKNHHRNGCFGEHVTWMKLRLANNDVVECSPSMNTDLFDATIGGMGLTGHILEVEFRMERIASPWIWMESRQVPSIDDFLRGLKEAGPAWPMTMGWIDCVSRGKLMGRGILMMGRWATPAEAPKAPPPEKHKLSLPFNLPSWALNRLTARAFNELYYRVHGRKMKRGVVHPDSFFYPLDAIHHWNRGYGKKGFTQYQCVLPEHAGLQAPRQFLELLTGFGLASPLCVIKDCGAQGRGLLSFPMPGTSIAVDLPIRSNTATVVAALNKFVIEKGGRMYLTKDNFTTAEDFRAMEPRLPAFEEVRRKWDPQRRLRSAQSVRMLGDVAP
ncbi:MAG: FAD-binding oxidoreductase [Deltaproteobacteria bacterium]|nr:FAD-binding oxidoreductase [Deltaproteobacteria bacterium]